MFSLIDCNTFFASVERVFHPGLKHAPVVVLSNNDGCIVALTSEAKALGLKRGEPIFKFKDVVERNKVSIFSTNMMLYAAMSRRITNIVRKSIAHVEVYSIDESFCDLNGYETLYNLEELMRSVADRIKLWTDIPVSVGVAPTKTLAKIGSKFAKKYQGYRSVCMIDTEEKRRKALALFDLADVWGIGRHTLEKLNYYGISTPLEFADKSESWVKTHLTKPGVQTWLELNGHPCIDTSEVYRNQTICTSRSFGDMVGDLPSLEASVATFASSCANKLRGQRAGCKMVSVFINSNRFREDLEQYNNAASITLLTPTSDTIEITKAALSILRKIYRPGVMYKKSGVILSDITPITPFQQDLFDPVTNRPQRTILMHTIDTLNQKFGLKTIQLAVEGAQKQSWKIKSEHRSSDYLTDLNGILTINI